MVPAEHVRDSTHLGSWRCVKNFPVSARTITQFLSKASPARHTEKWLDRQHGILVGQALGKHVLRWAARAKLAHPLASRLRFRLECPCMT